MPEQDTNHGPVQSLGQLLHSARRMKGLTSRQVAELCDYAPAMYSKIEAGRSVPPFWRVELIAAALGLDPVRAAHHWCLEALRQGHRASPRLTAHFRAALEGDRKAMAAERTTLAFVRELKSDPDALDLLREITRVIRSSRARISPLIPGERVSNFVDPNDLNFRAVKGCRKIRQCIVAVNPSGAGFHAVVLKVPPGIGGYHIQNPGPLGETVEIFSVIRGSGHLFHESPDADPGRESIPGPKPPAWVHHRLEPGAVGYYAARLLHCVLSDPHTDLVLYMVSFPYTRQQRAKAMISDGGEFATAELESSSIPKALKQYLRAAIASGTIAV